jgi:hypothetical protein
LDAGTLDSSGDTDLEEYAIKIDWNISDNHRANFRYSNLEQSKLRVNGINSSSVSLSSYWYQHVKTVESYVGQLFSDWTDNFSTEFKVSYRDYSAVRQTPTNAPSVRIYFGGTENGRGMIQRIRASGGEVESLAPGRLGYVHVGESHRGYLGSGSVDLTAMFRALHDVGYQGPIVFESFSSAVVTPAFTAALAIWREPWRDSTDLATHARHYITGQLRAAAAGNPHDRSPSTAARQP